MMLKYILFLMSLVYLSASCAWSATTKPTAITKKLLKPAKKSIKNLTKSLGVFGAWQAYQTQENGQNVYYMVSYPQKNTTMQKRAKNYLMITHRPASNLLNVFSCFMGYKMAVDQKIYMSVITPDVGKVDTKSRKKAAPQMAPPTIQEFILFTEGETAWATDAAMDQAIIQAINNKAAKIVIKENPKDKTEIIYSLKGADQALKAINKACGVK